MKNSYMGSMKDVLACAKHGTYDFTKDGKCSRCGGCCSNLLPMSQKEINQIHQYIKKHDIKPISHYPLVLAQKTIDMQCPFLDDSGEKSKCNIYEVRPMICREYICNKWADSDIMKLAKRMKEPMSSYNVRDIFYPQI